MGSCFALIGAHQHGIAVRFRPFIDPTRLEGDLESKLTHVKPIAYHIAHQGYQPRSQVLSPTRRDG